MLSTVSWAVDIQYSTINDFVFLLYSDVYKSNKIVKNFEEILNNFFRPLFEVTKNPESHRELHQFLSYVVGFDSVDDESKPEDVGFYLNSATPDKWESPENPPYTYYIFYMFSNLVSLNHFRQKRGLTTFALRPHCGEAGPGKIRHEVGA